MRPTQKAAIALITGAISHAAASIGGQVVQASTEVSDDMFSYPWTSAALVARHGPRMLLAPMNTGAIRPFAHPRGRETFLPLGEYPTGRPALQDWSCLRGRRDHRAGRHRGCR